MQLHLIAQIKFKLFCLQEVVEYLLFFTTVIGAPVGIASASFTSIFSLTTGIIKKLLSIKRNKRKKHDKILVLAKVN